MCRVGAPRLACSGSTQRTTNSPAGVTMLCQLVFEPGRTIELVPAPGAGVDVDARLQEVTAQ